jgi:hypothetical protein
VFRLCAAAHASRPLRRCGKWRPSALVLLPLGDAGTALLAGTVAGVFAAHVGKGGPAAASWVRLGDCSQLPLVLVAGLSHERTSDTVTAATMGRGVYTLPNAAKMAAAALGLGA